MTVLYIVVGLIALILVHELGHFLAAKFFNIKVEEFGLGFPPRIWGKKIGETLYSVNWLPFGGFVRILGESPLDEHAQDNPHSFIRQAPWRRAIVLSAGVIMNILAGWLLLSFVFLIGSDPFVVVQSVSPESPAETAGLQPGDVITNFATADDFITHINNNKGQAITFDVSRGSEIISTTAILRFKAPANQGLLGASLIDGGLESVPFGYNFIAGAKASALLLATIVIALINIITTIFSGISPDVIGPVGIIGFAYQVGSVNIIFVLNLLAMISLNLAIINLLPFPAIDGGRLIFLLVEKIKGSPLPVKIETYTNAIGFLLLLIIMILVTIKDISFLT